MSAPTVARQIVQRLRTGEIELLDLPAPHPAAHEVMVRTRASLLSAGTERMLLEFGRAGLIGKALQQPERVRLLLDRLRTDGVGPVLEAAFTKLDEPLPLGYANVGTICETGSAVVSFRVGDRVVSNAPHASWARVGSNLCARVPDSVSDEQASFVVPAAIGLQGLRLGAPTLGETFAVIGTGLIGLLSVQLLTASGCSVIAIDTRADRLVLAARFGARCLLASPEAQLPEQVRELTGGRGVDGVLITTATDSDAPLRDAAHMSRKRGRIILVGVAGLHLSRADFYAKELQLQVSCSYGPGRYDAAYEQRGCDYPLAYVRWTEQRNFEAVLELLANRRLDIAPLVSHRYEFEHAREAYTALLEEPAALGILLHYGTAGAALPARSVQLSSVPAPARSATQPAVSIIGAGAYARRFLLPALRDGGARLVTLASQGSALGSWAARKWGFEQVTGDASAAIASDACNTVVIATRHDTHAHFTCAALTAGKHVFVEKPLALTEEQLAAVAAAHQAAGAAGALLMVGFNRRFAPLAVELRRQLQRLPGPRSLIYTVNAGAIPAEHWTQDAAIGGGRLVGEACHFIDLLRFLVGSPICSVSATALAPRSAGAAPESATISLTFSDGSIGSVHYFATGARAFPKERLEVFAAGETWRLDNFRALTSFGRLRLKPRWPWRRQDKGNRACIGAFLQAVRAGSASPIPLEELLEVSRVTLEAAAQARLSAPGPRP